MTDLYLTPNECNLKWMKNLKLYFLALWLSKVDISLLKQSVWCTHGTAIPQIYGIQYYIVKILEVCMFWASVSHNPALCIFTVLEWRNINQGRNKRMCMWEYKSCIISRLPFICKLYNFLIPVVKGEQWTFISAPSRSRKSSIDDLLKFCLICLIFQDTTLCPEAIDAVSSDLQPGSLRITLLILCPPY